MATVKIQVTKNYQLFERHSDENRPLDLKKHKSLYQSMKRYGFLKCFPIVIIRVGSRMIVKDGQHRLAIAQELGLPVWWIEAEDDFDVAVINSTAKTWGPRDYAQRWAATGLADYREGIEFAERHGLPLGAAFALLAGTTSYGNVVEQFMAGEFVIKDRAWAEDVAGVYAPLVALAPRLRGARFIEACMAICRVPGFDRVRMQKCAHRCREQLVPYATREGFLDMLEKVYNFGRQQLVPLKIQATVAMRERNFAKAKRTAETS